MIEFELVRVARQLFNCESLGSAMQVLGSAARRVTGADGITLVLREGSQCYYADEDAIAPLWKGRRFPMEACISGWSMVNRQAVAIPDIYADPRIPHDAYRPTFVKSLAMVPIRIDDPVGAIGAYWEQPHEPSADELVALQALAEAAAVVRNLQQIEQLTDLVREATDALLLAERKLPLQPAPLELRELARQCAGGARGAFDSAGVALVLQLGDRPVWVRGDRERLAQALDHVLDQMRQRTERRGAVLLRVIADGQAVVTVEAAPALAVGGEPARLAIALALIRLHQGSLEPPSRSAAGGVRATIRLPLESGGSRLN